MSNGFHTAKFCKIYETQKTALFLSERRIISKPRIPSGHEIITQDIPPVSWYCMKGITKVGSFYPRWEDLQKCVKRLCGSHVLFKGLQKTINNRYTGIFYNFAKVYRASLMDVPEEACEFLVCS